MAEGLVVVLFSLTFPPFDGVLFFGLSIAAPISTFMRSAGFEPSPKIDLKAPKKAPLDLALLCILDQVDTLNTPVVLF